jgi:signal peptidase I
LVQWDPDVFSADSFGPIRIPADHFLMLGDNRDHSADSRYFGLVHRELLVGRGERILVSADVGHTWLPRFNRFGHRLR